MTTPHDAADAPESLAEALTERLDEPPIDGGAGPLSLFHEINERRARVENAELLQHLRSL
ncbi:MAG: hypothetical protein ACJ798_06350 [Phenylobacterium sp.]